MDEQQNGQNNPQPQPPNQEVGDNETVVQLQHDNPQPIVIQPSVQPIQETPKPVEPQPITPVETQQLPETDTTAGIENKPDYQYQSGNLQPNDQIGQTDAEPALTDEPTGDSISWSASEFVHHEKNSGWHLMIALGSVVLAVAIYFLTKSIFGAATIIVVGVIFSIFGKLKPRVLDYSITPEGLQIGEKHFDYLTFRSFAVIEEGQTPNLQLLPQKRFAVPITIYFAPADQDKIVNVLGEYLPIEHRERDFVDKLSSKLHF